MVWVRTPDDLYEREEVLGLGLDAVGYHLAALGYSNRNLTDGRVPRLKAETLVAVADPSALVFRLVAAGWWLSTDAGYQLVYLLDLQPTAASVLAKREASASRVAAHRARTYAPGNGVTNTVSTRLPVNPDPVPGTPVPDTGPGPTPSVSASGGARQGAQAPAAKPEGRTNVRLARIVDLVRGSGVVIHPTARDGRALKCCAAPAELVAEAYLAAARREWDPVGDGFLAGNLSLHLVIDRLAGYQETRSSRSGSDYTMTRYGPLRVVPTADLDDGAVAF